MAEREETPSFPAASPLARALVSRARIQPCVKIKIRDYSQSNCTETCHSAQSYKLLGVIITDDLSWNEHYDSIHKKSY